MNGDSLDSSARDALSPRSLAARLYDELRALAKRQVRKHSPHASLQPTELVHEAYARLLAAGDNWQCSRDYVGAAGKAMRSVLVDHARARGTIKRTAPGQRCALDELCDSFTERAIDLLALDDALKELAIVDAAMAQAVELRFFMGLEASRTAEVLNMPLRTFERRWATTRSWLYSRIG